MTLGDLKTRFADVSAEPGGHPDQRLGMVACEEALQAAAAGNYGVGAVLVDPRGEMVGRGQNMVFVPHFRSDLHAEMVVMNSFEEGHRTVNSMRGYTLMCSLEPCPMCLARLLVVGVQVVKFLAYDELAGMVGHRRHFPTAWQRLWQRQEFVQADVSESLRQLALDVFLLNLEACRQKILLR